MSGNNQINESLLMSYINKELSASDKTLVEQWLAQSEDNRKEFEELEKTWIITGQIVPKPVPVNLENAWEKVNRRIQTQPATKKSTGRIIVMRLLPYAAVAAVLALGVFALVRYLTPVPEQLTLTARNEVVIDTLQDGSIIALNQNSTLIYPEYFDDNERRVKLSGEGFFEIAKDPEHPFVIELNYNAEVKVLGTSFNIHESDSSTEVFVKTGKVEFSSSNDQVILIPGQKGILNVKTGHIEVKEEAAQNSLETYWLDRELDFEATELEEVLILLETIFGTTITLENPEAGKCPFTSHFERESLEHILEVISNTFELEIVKQNQGYLLKGNGC